MSEGGGLPSWVAPKIGQWGQIPDTALGALIYDGLSTHLNCFSYSGVAYDDTAGHEYIHGGGHAGGGGWGNRLVRVALNRDQPNVTILRGDTPLGQVTENQAYYFDGRPSATHTYHSTHISATLGTYIRFGKPIAWAGKQPGITRFPNIDFFNLASGDWEAGNQLFLPQEPSPPPFGATFTDNIHLTDRENDRRYFTYDKPNGTIWKWEAARPAGFSVVNRWISSDPVILPGQGVAVLDKQRNRIVIWYNTQRVVWPLTPAWPNTARPSAFTPTGPAAVLSTMNNLIGHNPAWLHIESQDLYMTFAAAASLSGPIIAMNPNTFATGVWPTTNYTAPAGNWHSISGGVWTRFWYAKKFKSILLHLSPSDNIRALRVDP